MLTAVVLTHNSASTLDSCLASLSFCDKLLLIDDHSSDATLAIARRYSAKVLTRPLNGDFAAQRNFALSHIKSGWILFIDSDEHVSSALARQITAVTRVPSFPAQPIAYSLRRLDTLWHRQLTHGDSAVDLVRLAQAGAGRWAGRVHERWQIASGPIGHLTAPLAHQPHPSVAQFVSQLNSYSTLRAEELFYLNKRAHILSVITYPVGKFIHLYLIKLGLLDGIPGLVSAMLMSFYSFLVRGKLLLLAKGIPPRRRP